RWSEAPGLHRGPGPADPRAARGPPRGRRRDPRPGLEERDARGGLPPSDGTGAAGMIFAVVRTHLARLKRDRAAFVLAFVVPVVFFSIFAGIFGSSRGATRRIPVAVVDEDGSPGSRRLIAALKAEKGLNVIAGRVPAAGGPEAPFDRASAQEAV